MEGKCLNDAFYILNGEMRWLKSITAVRFNFLLHYPEDIAHVVLIALSLVSALSLCFDLFLAHTVMVD